MDGECCKKWGLEALIYTSLFTPPFLILFFYLHGSFSVSSWTAAIIAVVFSTFFSLGVKTVRLVRCVLYVTVLNLFSSMGVLVVFTVISWTFATYPLHNMAEYLTLSNTAAKEMACNNETTSDFRTWMRFSSAIGTGIHYGVLIPFVLLTVKSLVFIARYIRKYDYGPKNAPVYHSPMQKKFYEAVSLVTDSLKSFACGFIVGTSFLLFVVEHFMFASLNVDRIDGECLYLDYGKVNTPTPNYLPTTLFILNLLCLLFTSFGKVITSFRAKIVRKIFPDKVGTKEARKKKRDELLKKQKQKQIEIAKQRKLLREERRVRDQAREERTEGGGVFDRLTACFRRNDVNEDGSETSGESDIQPSRRSNSSPKAKVLSKSKSRQCGQSSSSKSNKPTNTLPESISEETSSD